jgi:hypothetical protein
MFQFRDLDLTECRWACQPVTTHGVPQLFVPHPRRAQFDLGPNQWHPLCSCWYASGHDKCRPDILLNGQLMSREIQRSERWSLDGRDVDSGWDFGLKQCMALWLSHYRNRALAPGNAQARLGLASS